MHSLRGATLLPKLRVHFAEFLNKSFLARLRFLTPSTCVGLRYGRLIFSIAAFLGSGESATSLLFFTRSRISGYLMCGFAYTSPYLLGRLTNWALHLSFCVTTSLKRLYGGTGISTSFPSTTPFGLALGPDLPWADEPSPGILRFSAGRILTCLFAYLYRHSHFLTLQHSSRYTFVVLRTLLYQSHIAMSFRSFGV